MKAAVPGFRTDFLSPIHPIGVAVSGGADSIALLHLLYEVRQDLVVLHVNHQLRGQESEADHEFVFEQSQRLGLPFLAHRPQLASGNLESAARNARYSWFFDLINSGTVGQVATGHTRDDQAETVLFRFLRGAGTAGLAAILPQTTQQIIRPLLLCGRHDLRAFLERHAIPWREDSSNNWVRFGRNKIRHRLLPQLQQEWNPRMVENLVQTADWARAEEEYWDSELPRLAGSWLCFGNRVFDAVLPVEELNRLPPAVARRMVRWIFHKVSQGSLLLEFHHVERVLTLSRQSRGSGSFQAAGILAVRSLGFLRISRSARPPMNGPESLTVPHSCALPDGKGTLALELKSLQSVYNDDGHRADWSLIRQHLVLRSWQPGDRFHQAGHLAARKLKQYFQEAGIPSWERSGWPVITHENSILWTRGLGVAAPYAPSASTTVVLDILEHPYSVYGKTPNQKV